MASSGAPPGLPRAFRAGGVNVWAPPRPARHRAGDSGCVSASRSTTLTVVESEGAACPRIGYRLRQGSQTEYLETVLRAHGLPARQPRRMPNVGSPLARPATSPPSRGGTRRTHDVQPIASVPGLAPSLGLISSLAFATQG